MEGGLLQILLTVWISGHPVTWLLPKEYPQTNNACMTRAAEIFKHRKKDVRMEASCILAPTRSA